MENLELYKQNLTKIAKESALEAARIIENNDVEQNFRSYFVAANEIAIGAMRISLEENVESLKHFPLTCSFLAGIMFAMTNKKESENIIKIFDSSTLTISAMLTDLSFLVYDIIENYLKAKVELEEKLNDSRSQC